MIKILLDKFHALKTQGLDNKKVALIMLSCLIIIYIDFAILFKLQLKGIKTVSPKVAKLKTDIHQLSKGLANLKIKQVEIKKGQPRVKKIVLEREIPSLLERISVMANKNNVRIIKILPSKDTKSTSYILIGLDLTCDYHNLGSFLNDLENSQDFIAVEEIKIRSDMSNYFQQNVNLMLRIYVKK